MPPVTITDASSVLAKTLAKTSATALAQTAKQTAITSSKPLKKSTTILLNISTRTVSSQRHSKKISRLPSSSKSFPVELNQSTIVSLMPSSTDCPPDHTAIILAVVFSLVFLVFLIVFICMCCCFYCKKEKRQHINEENDTLPKKVIYVNGMAGPLAGAKVQQKTSQAKSKKVSAKSASSSTVLNIPQIEVGDQIQETEATANPCLLQTQKDNEIKADVTQKINEEPDLEKTQPSKSGKCVAVSSKTSASQTEKSKTSRNSSAGSEETQTSSSESDYTISEYISESPESSGSSEESESSNESEKFSKTDPLASSSPSKKAQLGAK